MTDVGDRIEEALNADVAGALVTKWVVIAETIDGESGEPTLEMFHSEHCALWDAIGFARYYAAFCERRIEVPGLDED